MENNMKRIYICIYNWSVVHQKLTQYCKSSLYSLSYFLVKKKKDKRGTKGERNREELADINYCIWNIYNLRYADDTTLMAESEEELKSLLKVKEKSERAGLKLDMQKN